MGDANMVCCNYSHTGVAANITGGDVAQTRPGRSNKLAPLSQQQ